MKCINSVKPFLSSNSADKCRYFFERMKVVDKESVSRVPDDIREMIRNNVPERLLELARINCFCAQKVKTNLDNEYGEGKYVLIAIGRSIASVAELMEKIGAQVRIIPLSCLRSVECIDDCVTPNGKRIYKEFLESKGLSGDILRSNPEKKYILTDYTNNGLTLKNTENLLRDIFGEVPNLKAIPIKNIIGEDYNRRGILDLLSMSRFKDYSAVGRLPAKEIEDVYKQASESTAKEYKGTFTQKMRKLFRFLTMDSYIEGNYDGIPLKEMITIEKRNSPKKTAKTMTDRLNKILSNCV
ncbi:hypothetical protein IKQ21_05270 [bacterium]|nr:hypothetical protein [bacterium]